jgi:hypothetical protein
MLFKAFSTDSPEVAHKIASSIMRLYALNDLIQFYVFVHKMETGTPDGKAGKSFAFEPLGTDKLQNCWTTYA